MSSQMDDIRKDLMDMIMDNYGNISYDNFSYDDCCEGGEVCDSHQGANFGPIFIPVLYSVAFVVGVLGNGLLLLLLIKNRKAWSVTDSFIFHLSVADVLLLFTLPLWAAQAFQVDGWTFGTPLCKITGAVFMVNFYCGIFLLACISLDRYLSIVHATQMYSRRYPWVNHFSCLLVWLFSLLLSIPDLIYFEAVKDSRRGRSECIRNYFRFDSQSIEKWKLVSRLLYHTVGFMLPSAVLVFCYSCILQQLRCGSQGLQKQKAVRVIVAVVLVFFLCWTPYNITLLMDTIQSNKESNNCEINTSLEKAMIITFSLGCLHCSLNPILYAFVGVKFRRQLRDILRYLGCKLMTGAKSHSATSQRKSSYMSETVYSHSVAI